MSGPSENCRAALKKWHTELREKKNASWFCDETDTVHIPLSNGLEALIDKADWELVAQYSWHPKKDRNSLTWYVIANVPNSKPRRSILLHRLIHPVSEGLEVDHKDRNGLNCRRDNLRDSTRVGNMMNVQWRRSKLYKGVRFRRGSYWARLRIKGKLKEVGGFETTQDAARAYNEMALLEYGEFAFLNRIQ
jgi:hypothetical protein